MKPNKKMEFLNRIKTDSLKYKRVSESPIRYAGGKSLGVGHIVEKIPSGIKRLVSPFFGGGSVEIAVEKFLDIEVIGYDIFDVLVNYWKHQIHHAENLYDVLKKFSPNFETYEKVKNRLEDHWDLTTKNFEDWSRGAKKTKRYKNAIDLVAEWKKKETLNDLDLAAHYFFNFNLSYGPGFLGWSSDIYLNETKYKKMLRSVKYFRAKKLNVFCSDFQDVIRLHSNDFLYCDPPYFIGEDSKMFKGIYPMRNIPIHHVGFDHESLASLLNEHSGGFVLSYNDCSQVREWYKNFEQSFPIWQYTMGQGETRIGKNRTNENHVKKSHEILIFSPPR